MRFTGFGGGRMGARLALLSAVTMLVFAALSSTAIARKGGGLALKSPSEGIRPREVCGAPSPGRAKCLAIVDPTAGVAPAARAKPGGVAPTVCSTGEYEYCGSGAHAGLSPQDLQSAYRLPSTTAGAGQTVAIVDAFDDPNAQSDLNVYRKTYGLPPCEAGCFSKVDETGGTTYPAGNSLWALEISLDLDMVSAACPQCHILLVEAKLNSDMDLGIAENEAASLGATEISNSYSGEEIEYHKLNVEYFGKYYEHPGLPITASAGDDGFEDEATGQNCRSCSPNFPGDLTNVISVGGTELLPEGESGRGWGESVWSRTGGGCTLYIAKPAWQTNTACANRTDNDVAAVASWTSPVSAYDTYELPSPGWQDEAGTSASAPFIAGVVALESSALRSEGLAGIYSHPGNWWDITSGTNWLGLRPDCTSKYLLCHAVVGYDGPTGMGTPHGSASATPPSAVTEAASSVTTTSATISGLVNPETSPTTYSFQYGSSTRYGHELPAGGGTVTGYSKPVLESVAFTGLKTSTLYHYRVLATNAGGTTYGADRTFSTPPEIYSLKFGTAGSEAGQLSGPQYTAVDHNGDVWVSDYANNRIEEFSATGAYIRSCVTVGNGVGSFNGPTGIAVSPSSGYLYVSDSGNHRIVEISPVCAGGRTIGGPLAAEGGLSKPMGLTFGPGGEFTSEVLAVADAATGLVDFLEPFSGSHGKFAGSYGTGVLHNPTDVQVASKEGLQSASFYVVDSGDSQVQVVRAANPCLECSLHFELLRSFGSAGTGNGQLSNPTAIAVDPTTGDPEVTDTGNNRVEEFLPSGAYIAKFGSAGSGASNFQAPKGIAVSPSGATFVADSANNRIDVWGPSQTVDPMWNLLSTEDPAGTVNSYLESVSCPGTEACTAVGLYDLSSGGFRPLAEAWNGSSWKSQAMALPAGSETTMAGVSCSSSTACSAVGYYLSSAGVYRSLAEVWNGTSWSVQATPEPTGTKYSMLDGISCSASTACTAVGWYEAGGVELPLVERWNGTAWAAQTAPQPSGAKASYPHAVKCLSATACTLAGFYETTAGAYVPFAETWNGTTWTVQSMPSPTGSTYPMLTSMSCTSSTSCLAAGYYFTGTGAETREVPFSERWDGTAWTLVAMPTPAGTNSNSIHGLSCGSSTSCNAVGTSTTTAGKGVTLGEHWDGSTWTVQSTPNAAGEESFLSGGISCHTATSCIAVGNHHVSLAEIWQ
jgi:hypothetical protein